MISRLKRPKAEADREMRHERASKAAFTASKLALQCDVISSAADGPVKLQLEKDLHRSEEPRVSGSARTSTSLGPDTSYTFDRKC